jgi:hypothetical protein
MRLEYMLAAAWCCLLVGHADLLLDSQAVVESIPGKIYAGTMQVSF